MNGRKTSAGNHAGHVPSATSATPNAAARKPSGTAPTSPMMIRDGGRLTAKNGAVAAASAKNAVRGRAREDGAGTVGGESEHGHRCGQSVVAVHEIVEVEGPRRDGGRQQGHRQRSRPQRRGVPMTSMRATPSRCRTRAPPAHAPAGGRRRPAHARRRAARPAPAQATGPATARSRRARAATPTSATGNHPAQMASPLRAGAGATCSERSLGASCGSFARARRRTTVASALTVNANAMPAAERQRA